MPLGDRSGKRIGLPAFACVLAISSAELACWSIAESLPDPFLMVLASVMLAGAAGLMAFLLGFGLPPLGANVLPVAAASWLFLEHLLRVAGLRGGEGSWLSVLLALSGAGVLCLLSMRRPGLVLALGVSGVSLVLVGVGEWKGRPEARPPPSRGGPDVVFLVMDTTRRDHLSLYGYPHETTPKLDALAADARVYDDAWSVAPWTSPSHASMFTGLLPAEHDADGSDAVPLPDGLTTLPGLLRDAGFRTAGFAANPNLHSAGWSRDFDVYGAPWIRGKHTLVGPLNQLIRGAGDPWKLDLDSGIVLKQAMRWWRDNQDGRRFLFINLMDPHAPYQAPERDRQKFVGNRDCTRADMIARGGRYEYADTTITHDEALCIAALYDAEVHAMDRQIGEFFEWLAERGELDRTLVLITSDHGERLGEGGHVGHLLEMDQHLLRVPLILRYPERLAPYRVRRRVQLTGLPGSVLALAGVEMPEVMEARSLDNTWTKHSVAQHRNYEWYLRRIRAADPQFDDTPYRGDWMAVADERFLMIWSAEQGPDGAHLFDHGQDAALKNDLALQYPEEADRLREIGRKLPVFPDRIEREKSGPIDPELRARLKKLGYVE